MRAVRPPTVGWEQNMKEAYEAGAMGAITEVLAKHKDVANLVANGWIHLFVMAKDGRVTDCSDGRGGWRPVTA